MACSSTKTWNFVSFSPKMRPGARGPRALAPGWRSSARRGPGARSWALRPERQREERQRTSSSFSSSLHFLLRLFSLFFLATFDRSLPFQIRLPDLGDDVDGLHLLHLHGLLVHQVHRHFHGLGLGLQLDLPFVTGLLKRLHEALGYSFGASCLATELRLCIASLEQR